MILKHKWLIISLILAVFTAIFRFNSGVIQQDNYVGYAMGQVNFFDSRLFPGLPLLIKFLTIFTGNFYLAGYIIIFLSFVGSYFLLYKMTGSKLSVLSLIFPPILFNLITLIDTEFPFIFLTLLGVYLIKNKKLALAFLVFGVSVWFRLSGVALLAGVFMYFMINKNLKKFFVYLPYFLIPIILFLIYNAHFYGPKNLFYQLSTYEALHLGRISIGVVQLGEDLIRAVRWHWYRIFISGLFYVIFFAALWFKSIKIKSLEFWMITMFYVFTLIINLVPFLENLGRYLAPTVPLFWLIYFKYFKSKNWLYFLLPISALVVLI